MRLGKYGKLFHHDVVALGDGRIDRYTLFEWKALGGIILNVFNTEAQDRFHTHAFPAISIMLRGMYLENIWNQPSRIRTLGVSYLPKTLNHRIMWSTPNAISITICGPWDPLWTETRAADGSVRAYGWGRERVQ